MNAWNENMDEANVAVKPAEKGERPIEVETVLIRLRLCALAHRSDLPI